MARRHHDGRSEHCELLGKHFAVSGMTIEALSEQTGLSRQTLYRIVREARHAETASLEKIAAVLGVSIDYPRKKRQ